MYSPSPKINSDYLSDEIVSKIKQDVLNSQMELKPAEEIKENKTLIKDLKQMLEKTCYVITHPIKNLDKQNQLETFR